MERQRSQNKDIELLLNALENNAELPSEVESLDLTNDVVDFINVFNIFEGPNRILVSSLYQHYKAWSPTPIEYQSFHIIIKKYFKVDVIKRVLYVHIKNDLIDLNNQVVKSKKEKKHLKKSYLLKKHIELFIKEMEIIPSEKWIDIDKIYEWYIKWRYSRKNLKLKRKDLKDLLRFYFVSRIGKTRGFFKLKGEFNMEKINQLRGIHEEKREQKVKNKVFSSEARTKSKDKT